MANVATLRGFSDEVSDLWTVHSDDPDRLVLRLATESSQGIDALWQLPSGRGRVFLSASGTLLTNENVGGSDARYFVANLIRHHLAPGGAVIFDDMHQGLSALYDASRISCATSACSTRSGSCSPRGSSTCSARAIGSLRRVRERTEPRQGDFLAAAGGFMARRLDPWAAGSLLIDEWFDEVRARAGSAAGKRSTVDRARGDSDARARHLRGAERVPRAARPRRRPVDLARLHNVLKRAREAIG